MKNFFKFNINPLRITRMFTYSLCNLYIIFIPIILAVQSVISKTNASNDFTLNYFVCIVIGLLFAYIPMVFLVIPLCTVLEATISNSNIRGINIDYNSWQGKNGPLLIKENKKNLCAHCWLMPLNLIISSYGILLIINVCLIIIVVRSFLIFISISLWLMFGYRFSNNFKQNLKDVLFDFYDSSNLFDTAAPNRYKINLKNINFSFIEKILLFFSKLNDVIKAIKNKACPTINWIKEEKYENSSY